MITKVTVEKVKTINIELTFDDIVDLITKQLAVKGAQFEFAYNSMGEVKGAHIKHTESKLEYTSPE